MSSSSLVVNVDDLLEFFDARAPWAARHSAGIVAMIFEDLAAAVFERCLVENGATDVTVRCEPVTPGGKKGPWLDRWIEVDLPGGRRVRFQTEIKSVSGQAVGAPVLAVDASEDRFAKVGRQFWDDRWDSGKNTLAEPNMAKVLIPMKLREGMEPRELLPLLIFWCPLVPGDEVEKRDEVAEGHLFSVSNVTYDFPFVAPWTWDSEGNFDQVWFFSMSSYLRSIRHKTVKPLELKLKMPRAANKVQALMRLVQVPTEVE